MVVSGLGWAQLEGAQIVGIRPGDVIWCPPGRRHREGATPDQAMTYVAIQEEGGGDGVQLLDAVTEEGYRAGPPAA